MTSRNMVIPVTFFLTLIMYIPFYLMGMINETSLARLVALAGLAPLVVYIPIWISFSYLSYKYRPHYHFIGLLFILFYLTAGILLFGFSMNTPFPEKVFLVSIQIVFLLFSYGLSIAKFNPESSARKLKKSIRQQEGQIHIVGLGLSLQGSYDRVPKYRWLSRLYTTGKTLFYLTILPLALLGGGAGLVMVRLLESTDLGVNGVSPHSMIIYFCSLFFAIMVGFAGPAVRFNFQWWRELDSSIRQEYGHVEYVWEKSK